MMLASNGSLLFLKFSTAEATNSIAWSAVGAWGGTSELFLGDV